MATSSIGQILRGPSEECILLIYYFCTVELLITREYNSLVPILFRIQNIWGRDSLPLRCHKTNSKYRQGIYRLQITCTYYDVCWTGICRLVRKDFYMELKDYILKSLNLHYLYKRVIFWTFFSFNDTTSVQVLKTVPVLKNLQSPATGIAV